MFLFFLAGATVSFFYMAPISKGRDLQSESYEPALNSLSPVHKTAIILPLEPWTYSRNSN